MQTFKRVLRYLLLALLIVLAVFGIGLVGGVPLPKNNRKKEKTELASEQKDTKKKDEIYDKL